ncbi:MAG: type IV pilus assembly protein FimV [Pseudomonadota bacterium]
MKRLILLAVLAAWGAVSPLAMALDVGEPNVESSLDAPLQATVPLTDTDGFSAGDMRVGLAEPSAFRALGLDWTSLTENVSISLEGGSRPYLQLTSSTPVNDPWLDLLLTLETPDGRQTQVLTLLFDPPSTPSASSSDAGLSRAISSAPAGSRSSREPAYINRGDTLWSVAERVKPSEASVQQMMLALLEANESRFPSGNINDMRAGSTLEMPGDAVIFSQSPANAARIIDTMNTAWRNRGNEPAQSVSTASSSSASSSQTTATELGEPSESATPSEDKPLVDVALAEAAVEGGSAADSNDPDVVISPQAIEVAQALNRQLREVRLDEQRQQLDQLRQERELMQADIEALRNEVASLNQALAAAQTLALQDSSPRQPAEQAAVMNEASAEQRGALAQAMAWSQGVYTQLLRDSRWPLAAAAILLLLLLLLMIRRRQAREWQEVQSPQADAETSDASSAVQPSVAPKTAYVQPVAAQPAPAVTHTGPQTSDTRETDEAATHSNPNRFSAIEEARETVQVTPRNENTSEVAAGSVESQPADLGRSQASGLVGKASIERAVEEPEERQKAASEDDAQADEPAETEQQHDNNRHKHVIDYQPPSLSAEPQSDKNAETLMQPTVEFEAPDQLGHQAEKKPPSHNQKRVDTRAVSQETDLDNDWEIEEVAFQRPGRDNTRSP